MRAMYVFNVGMISIEMLKRKLNKPIPKQQHSDKDVRTIDGPTSASAAPIASDVDRYLFLSIRSYA